ncbi:hypothetical protein [Pedobacter sp. L105]|uniref:hypothetical protein n=1 Tax=Pedobacter sp. L105 TaxID=1641871 RepID=UPI00131E2FFB|nr:hypothetical protein [Pedobacter sp. L105]
MKVQIGMLIWKEMKRQGFSQGSFVKLLRDRNVFLRDIFQMETIDVNSLLQISDVLKVNFFQFYEAEELITLLKTEEKDTKHVAALKEVIKTQNKLLSTHKEMIRQQDQFIEQLQKNYPAE